MTDPGFVDVHPEGALSRIDAAKQAAALALGRTGRVFDLGSTYHGRMPTANDYGTFPPFRLIRHRSAADPSWDRATTAGTTFSNELVFGTTHQGTHIDAFCHVQRDGRIYGGEAAADVEWDDGWRSRAIETVKPIITRGVLVDLAAHRGVDLLPDGEPIGAAEMQAAVAAQGVRIERGDAVLVRTGKIAAHFADPAAWQAGQPGIGADAAVWLYDQGMAALGADNFSIEPQPIPDWETNVHIEMLYRRGVHLIEWLVLDDLAAAGVKEFCFICLPLKITGSTGSWVRPIAIV